MRVGDIYDYLDEIAPFATAEGWDNGGLLVGDREAQVRGILTALDATVQVIEEAAEQSCNLIVTHHPVIFHPIKGVLAGEPAYEAARRGIAILSAHTNYDVAAEGVNAILAAKLGLTQVVSLRGAGEPLMGCVGRLPHPMSPEQLGLLVAHTVGLAPRYNPQGRPQITHLGLCGGSGADLMLDAAPPHPYEAFLTADVKHHQFLEAARRGITLYDGGHYATEAVALPALTEKLRQRFPTISVRAAERYAGEVLCTG